MLAFDFVYSISRMFILLKGTSTGDRKAPVDPPVNVKTYGGGSRMPALRRVARRTARRTAARQSAAAPSPQAAPEAPAAAAPAAPVAPEKPAYMAELEQLNQLKEQGILSEEEYAAKKAQILGI